VSWGWERLQRAPAVGSRVVGLDLGVCTVVVLTAKDDDLGADDGYAEPTANRWNGGKASSPGSGLDVVGLGLGDLAPDLRVRPPIA
jgi:hypothetical protein